ncbi:hypothetical protein [Cupriavidus sp. M-11]|uniref:hypothetical protein n=1 Tax=Cupriavidus sp. M-11 TaxID=3233038 RepID=UPI003F9380EE
MMAWLGREAVRMARCLLAAAHRLERLGELVSGRAGGTPAKSAQARYDEAAQASWQIIRHGLSHDLRTPHSAILALVELRLAAPPLLTSGEFAAQAAGCARASLRLVDDLARLLRELQHDYRMERLEWNALAGPAAQAAWNAEQPGRHIVLSPLPQEVAVHGDPAMLSELLRVLMALSLDAAREGSPARLHQRICGGVCRLSGTRIAEAGDAGGAGAADAGAMQFCKRVLLRHGGLLRTETDAWHIELPMLP